MAEVPEAKRQFYPLDVQCTVTNESTRIMEADEINVIANTLADLAVRTAELRRYL